MFYTVGVVQVTSPTLLSIFVLFVADEDPSSVLPLPPTTHLSENQPPLTIQNRYQNVTQNGTSSLLSSNLLGGSLGPIGQPYSAEICNYGPMYHPHNILHNYNPVYSNDKGVRGGNFGRGVYGNYSGFYGNSSNLRTSSLHQGSYDFTPR